jgi:hypothetical protein
VIGGSFGRFHVRRRVSIDAVMMSASSERRVAAGIVVASILVFVGLLALVSPFYRSFDESKYLGIGYSMLAGHGPRTVFGAVFLPHSPLWPMVVAAPDVWFGINAFDWGHLLNAIAGVGVLGAVAALGWQVRPVVGALSAVGYLAVPYLHDLTRTARLDVPAAALILIYLIVGIDAVKRGSVRRGLLAGFVFAVAFLVKEIALPFAPVPYLVGILVGRPLSAIARVAAAALAVAIVGMSWWFLMFASFTNQVYRLGTPGWTLGPLAIASVVVIVLGLAAPRLAARPSFASAAGRVRDRAPKRLRRHERTVVGWGLGLAWFLGLTVFFDRQSELKGNGLFQPGQYALYIATWLPQLLLVVVFGVIGVVLGLIARQRSTGAARDGIDAMLMATLCGAPLILLVIAVGEPPRNYLAQIGILVVVAAAGWLHAIEWALTSRRSALTVVVLVGVGAAAGAIVAQAIPALSLRIGLPIGALAGLAIAFRPARFGPVSDPAGHQAGLSLTALGVGLVAVLVMATTVLAGHALTYRESASGNARAGAVGAASSWIVANRPPGTKIGFGSFLGYETALDVATGYPMVQIHQALAVFNPTAPLGLAPGSGPPVDDWIAVENSRREREFYVFRGSVFAKAVKASGISIYVYDTGPTTSVPSLLGALTPDHGFTELATQSFPVTASDGQTSVTEMHIFAVDPSKLDFSGTKVYISDVALTRLVGLLENDPATSPATAAALADRLSPWADAQGGPGLIDRLRTLARR